MKLRKIIFLTIIATISMTASALMANSVILDQSPEAVGGTINGPWNNVYNEERFYDKINFLSSATITGMDLFIEDDYGAVGQSVIVSLITGDYVNSPQNFTETISIKDFDGGGMTYDWSYNDRTGRVARVHVDFTTPLSLLSDTDYWIGLSGESWELSALGLTGASGPTVDGLSAIINSSNTVWNWQVEMPYRLEGELSGSSPVPIPATALLFGSVITGIAGIRRKFNKA
jgi:hypothetical protein